MGLSEITIDAVLDSISEYDILGKEKFLQKYGFSDAINYFLIYKGKEYPSKAIIGVSFQYIGKGRKPLSASEFSGGEITVKHTLEKLGFNVVVRNRAYGQVRKIAVTGYWTFFCNPKTWEIDKFLRQGLEFDYWQFNPWYKDDCKSGQLGVIRVGHDHRTSKQHGKSPKLERGIYAVIEILSEPMERPEAPDRYWLDWQESDWEKPVVKVRYVHNLINTPLLLGSLANNPIISQDNLLVSGFQNVVMPLKESVFRYILELIDKEDEFTANVVQEPVNTFENVLLQENKYREAVPEVKEVISKRIERGPVAKMVKGITNYKCLICDSLGKNPYTFTKKDGEPYIEAHHIIPVYIRQKGSLSFTNIITVCANHHRQLHFGKVELISNSGETLVLKLDGQPINIKKVSINL